jgi:hypothetical protein
MQALFLACFWLEKHKVWKRPQGIFPSLPSEMDKILKIHFHKFMKQGKLPPELCENNYCYGLKLFSNEDLLKKWQNNFKGVSYIDKEGNELHGAVDNILVRGKAKNERLVVLDYKTRGFPVKEEIHKSYQLQMDVYTFLLRKNGYKTEEYALLLFYVPKEVMEDGAVLFDSEVKRVAVNSGNGEKVWKRALEVLNGECPKVNEECGWCRYKKFLG